MSEITIDREEEYQITEETKNDDRDGLEKKKQSK